MNIKKIAMTGAASAVMLGAIAVPVFAKNNSKVDVCHLEGNGSYHKINVSEKSLAAHIKHGDILPGTVLENESIVEDDCAVFRLIETLELNSNDINGVNSTTEFVSGETYKVISSGTWTNRPGEDVDTKYTTMDSWTTPKDAPQGGYPDELLEVQINQDFVDWGVFSSDNKYEVSYSPLVDGVFNFRVFDGDVVTNTPNPGWYGDNNGTLSVKIYGL